MAGDVRSAELLRIIAETVGVGVETFRTPRSEAALRDQGAAHHETLLLMRMVRAFLALPDATSRLQALQFVEALTVAQSENRS